MWERLIRVVIYFHLRFLFRAQVKFVALLAVWNGVGSNFSFAGHIHLVVTVFVIMKVKIGLKSSKSAENLIAS